MKYIISIILMFAAGIASARLDECNLRLLDSLNICLERVDELREMRAQQYRQLKREYRSLPRGLRRVELAFEIDRKSVV